MEIRELGAEDIPSLLKLYAQLDPHDENLSPEQSLAIWNEDIEGNRNIRYFGAVEDGKVVSTCYCVIIPNLTKGGRPLCFVENVVTDSEFRQRGLAAKVLDKAVAFAREHNCYKVILQSGSARTDAHRFYEHFGFNGSSKKAFDMRLEADGAPV